MADKEIAFEQFVPTHHLKIELFKKNKGGGAEGKRLGLYEHDVRISKPREEKGKITYYFFTEDEVKSKKEPDASWTGLSALVEQGIGVGGSWSLYSERFSEYKLIGDLTKL